MDCRRNRIVHLAAHRGAATIIAGADGGARKTGYGRGDRRGHSDHGSRGAAGGFRGGGGGGGRGDAQGQGRGGREGRGGDTSQPYEKAQDHLATAFPLRSPEWAAWSAAMRSPRLAGRWALAGYQRGQGPI